MANCTFPGCARKPAPYQRDGHDGLVCADHGQVLAVIEPGDDHYYLGYMASPWTCVAYDPDTDEASLRFGQPGYHPSDEVVVWPRHNWRSLVWTSHAASRERGGR